VNQPEQFRLKVGLAEMLKGGVIMDVMTADQARIAEEAGAAAVMALERIPARIRREGGVARMSDPALIKEIEAAVSVPVMAKCRIGHIAEAQILESREHAPVRTIVPEEHAGLAALEPPGEKTRRGRELALGPPRVGDVIAERGRLLADPERHVQDPLTSGGAPEMPERLDRGGVLRSRSARSGLGLET